jgi:SAM-dependent methyltransferase
MRSMVGASALAPGVPPDYYQRILANEDDHWWYRGMLRITESLLGERLLRPTQRVLDAGCGTGGFLRWILRKRPAWSVSGVDIGSEALELARTLLPNVDFRQAPLRSLPFDGGSFYLVVSNDVLQHVHEDDVEQSLAEIRRVLRPAGALLLRTNGATSLRRERADWRRYDSASLRRQLESAGLVCERLTYANTLLSLYGAARRRSPRAPSDVGAGIPRPDPSLLATAVGTVALSAEARWLARPNRRLPYGHTLIAVARPA